MSLDDSRAFEPLRFGRVGEARVNSSESWSHWRLGGFVEREYAGAEMSIYSFAGVEVRRIRIEAEMPDALQLRMTLGHALATRDGDTDADGVIPNPESGRGVSYGIAEGLGKPLKPGLVKQAQAVRTFQETGRRKRMIQVTVTFVAMDSTVAGRRISMGDDSIAKGRLNEGGAMWSVYNAEARSLEFWVSCGAPPPLPLTMRL